MKRTNVLQKGIPFFHAFHMPHFPFSLPLSTVFFLRATGDPYAAKRMDHGDPQFFRSLWIGLHLCHQSDGTNPFPYPQGTTSFPGIGKCSPLNTNILMDGMFEIQDQIRKIKGEFFLKKENYPRCVLR